MCIVASGTRNASQLEPADTLTVTGLKQTHFCSGSALLSTCKLHKSIFNSVSHSPTDKKPGSLLQKHKPKVSRNMCPQCYIQMCSVSVHGRNPQKPDKNLCSWYCT